MKTPTKATYLQRPVRQRRDDAVRRLRTQAGYLDYPEGKLLFAVIENGVADLSGVGPVNGSHDPRERDRLATRARSYFEQPEIQFAELLGLDSDYVRQVLREHALL